MNENDKEKCTMGVKEEIAKSDRAQVKAEDTIKSNQNNAKR